MKARTLLIATALFLTLTSCMSIALSLMGVYKDEAEIETYNSNDRTMVYIPMRHIGTKGFYKNVTHKIDSLQDEGYIVFMESVAMDTLKVSKAKRDTIYLKMRKIAGVNISRSGYLDTVNNRLMGRRYKNRRDLINQPRYTVLGTDSIKDRIVDVPMDKLVEEYELQFGKIILNPCDYTTGPDEKYDCGKAPEGNKDYVVLTYRNKKLAEAIMNEPHKKIAVVYGALHETGLYNQLKQQDTTWKWKYHYP